MSDVINDLYEVIVSRREAAGENSYTAYLFHEGLDKILKKVGEESAETIIAAKSHEAAFANSFAGESASDKAARANSFASDSVPEAEAPASRSAPEESFGTSGPAPDMAASKAQINSYAESARAGLTNEVADLVYHLLVMLVERGVTWDEIEDILEKRAGKTGNLKPLRNAQEGQAT
jgi:phosphoribosyl-ATP pyrophosphohydrolase